ncbi:MAG: SPFH domain-containing protein [Ruminiclostridium sp.]|nr:SPFH domain-containing protein [Ruminiclostridium sp.]
MGLIKAGLNAIGTAIGDQWLEHFYCDSLDDEVLMIKGKKRTTEGTSNTKASDNIISNGSVISVADGQCALIVDNGKVVEVAAEAGDFKYDSSTEPSVFAGSFGKSLIDTFKTIGRRISFGGDTGRDQRVYYINTKFVPNNLFGTPEAIPFKVVDEDIGLKVSVSVRCNGRYVFQIENPLLFYTNLASNVTNSYLRKEIEPTLKNEFISALQPALGKISQMGVLPEDITTKVPEICEEMNNVLSSKWRDIYGIKVVSVAFNPITLPPEDAKALKEAQQLAMYRNPAMMAAKLGTAQAEAMVKAADNPNGAMMGFMGMGMAQQAGGMNVQGLYQMAGAQQPAQAAPAAQPAAPADGWTCSCGAVNTGKFCSECAKPKPVPVSADSWTCSCGNVNTGKFCSECAKPKPADKPAGWTCSCGAVNGGKFCTECAKPKPAGEPLYRCDKCGWEPEDPKNPPKFCPECADPFNDADIK